MTFVAIGALRVKCSLCTTLLPNFYPVKLQLSSCKHVFSIRKKTVDPDGMASSEDS